MPFGKIKTISYSRNICKDNKTKEIEIHCKKLHRAPRRPSITKVQQPWMPIKGPILHFHHSEATPVFSVVRNRLYSPNWLMLRIEFQPAYYACLLLYKSGKIN